MSCSQVTDVLRASGWFLGVWNPPSVLVPPGLCQHSEFILSTYVLQLADLRWAIIISDFHSSLRPPHPQKTQGRIFDSLIQPCWWKCLLNFWICGCCPQNVLKGTQCNCTSTYSLMKKLFKKIYIYINYIYIYSKLKWLFNMASCFLEISFRNMSMKRKNRKFRFRFLFNFF